MPRRIMPSQKWPMALTKEQQESASNPSTGDSDRPLPNYGKVVGKVHIILENTTFTKAGSNGAPAWSGTLIDGYYDLCENDTMMTAVLKALQLKGCNWSTGAQGVASSWDDYGISYLASIKVPKEGQMRTAVISSSRMQASASENFPVNPVPAGWEP